MVEFLTGRLMNNENKDAQFFRDTESIAFADLDDRQLAMLDTASTACRCDRYW